MIVPPLLSQAHLNKPLEMLPLARMARIPFNGLCAVIATKGSSLFIYFAYDSMRLNYHKPLRMYSLDGSM